MSVRFCASVVAGLLLSVAASAADQPAQKKSDIPGQKIVCKVLAPITGTRLGTRRICLTQERWDQRQQAGRDFINRREIQHGFYRPDGGGGPVIDKPARH